MVMMMVVKLLENACWCGEQVPCRVIEARAQRFVRVKLGFVLEIALHLVAGLYRARVRVDNKKNSMLSNVYITFCENYLKPNSEIEAVST